MRSMTCKQLGGPCDKVFRGNSFEEIAEQSKKHGMEMYQKGDEAHVAAIGKMMELMKNPEGMKEWFDARKKEFDESPEEN